MATIAILIEVDDHRLSSYDDSHLAALWHVAQANPADGFENRAPAELAERIGREIIRRWLAETPPELYRHQGNHYYWHQLSKLGGWTSTGEFVARSATGAEGEPDRGQGCPDCERAGTGQPVPGRPGLVGCGVCSASWDQQTIDTAPASGGGR